MKTVHSFDYATGVYLGPVVLADGDRSPLEPGVFLIPGNCVELEPPEVANGQVQKWNGAEWAVEDLPMPVDTAVAFPEPTKTTEQLNEETRVMRAAAYREKADPLFFKWQRSEATEEEWKAAIEDIKARFPKVL